MRIIAGEFRSRRLKPVPGMNTRPTPDRLREALFSILQPVIEGSVFVDAYAGTGAVGIEALSRGAARVAFLERNPAAVAVIRENLQSLGIGPERARVYTGAAGRMLERACEGASIVFLDPPYEEESEYEKSLAWLGAHPPALVVVQHAVRFNPGGRCGALERCRSVVQGGNGLAFYREGREGSS